MLKIVVKSSAYELRKSIEDNKLKELKAKVIEILKKHDSNEVKKAIEYIESQEYKYTHLEKSLEGKWIEKAGYGVGTIRIWKGKKYKKVSTSPTRWVRVFDKTDRGAKSSMTRLIHKVENCKSVDELYQFCMSQHSLFQDENGVDLPIMDQLRAAIDERKNTIENGGNKDKTKTENETYNPDEPKNKESSDYKKQYKHTMNRLKNGLSQKEIDDIKDTANSMLGKDDYSKDGKIVEQANLDAIKDFESEVEKQKKRSDGMKGNKNAYKGKPDFEKMSKDELEKYKDELYDKYIHIDVKNKNKLGEARLAYREALDAWRDKIKNSGHVLSEFKTQLLNKLTNGIESQKKACENWDLSQMSDGNLKRYIDEAGKWTDKGIVHLADPIIEKFENSKKEMFDSNDFVGPSLDYQAFAVAHSGTLEKMKKELASRQKKTADTEENKKTEIKKEEPVKEQNVSVNPYEQSDSTDINAKNPIATNKSIGENEVEMPYSKELHTELKTLVECVSKDESRKFMTKVYYQDGNLVATDGRRLKVVKVGELEGIPDGSYVDINSEKTGIKIKKIDVDGNFPDYKGVIPHDLKQKATLDNVAVKNKIKEMYADGAIDKKGINLVQLEFRDGKIFIDDTPVGNAKDIKLKAYTGSWSSRTKEDTNFVSINASYLMNALNGDESTLMMSDMANKAMAINTSSTVHVLVPMNGQNTKVDYSEGRKSKAEMDKYEEDLRNAKKASLDDYIKVLNVNVNDQRYNTLKNAVLEADKTILERGYEAYRKAKRLYDNPKMSVNHYENQYGFQLLAFAQKYPEFEDLLKNRAKELGIEVKKSLLDFLDVELENIEDEEDENRIPSYNASQPELFNAIPVKVEEALNSVFGC